MEQQLEVIEPTESESGHLAKVNQMPSAVDPGQLIVLAVQQGADIDKLEKLMELQERWDANNARKKFFDSFATFQSIVPMIKKRKQGHNYTYAPLGDIAEQIRAALDQCKLSYRFEIKEQGESINVTCIVSHRLGHQELTSMSGAADTSGSKNAIQSLGSTVTYLQRFTLIGALGLTTADDDIDGRISSETITEGQAASMKARLEATSSNVQKFCSVLAVPNIDAMPSSKYAQADRMLTKKEAVKAEVNNEGS